MKIGIDFSGTITKYPGFFRIFAESLMLTGHEVHIVTASPSRQYVASRLQCLGIRYTEIWVPDDILANIPEWKSEIARKIGLTALIDDDPANLAGPPEEIVWMRMFDT